MDTVEEILFRKFGKVGVCLDCEVKDEKICQLTREVQHYIGVWGKLSRENAKLCNEASRARQTIKEAAEFLKRFA